MVGLRFQAKGQICEGTRRYLGPTSSLQDVSLEKKVLFSCQECAENTFFMGGRFFDWRRENRWCHMCDTVAADGTSLGSQSGWLSILDLLRMATRDPGWNWHPNTIGGRVKQVHFSLEKSWRLDVSQARLDVRCLQAGRLAGRISPGVCQ